MTALNMAAGAVENLPGINVIEQFIEGKTGKPELCEDGITLNENFAAVIDGATSKAAQSLETKSRGRIAMELIKEAILEMDAEIDAIGAICQINKRIKKWYEERGILEQVRIKTEERCTASLIIYSNVKKEIWLAGDCQAIVNGRLVLNEKKVDKLYSDVRALLIHAELSQGKTEADLLEHDTSRERLMELLRQQTKLQNTTIKSEFAYYAIDGFEWEGFAQEPESKMKIVSIPEPQGEIVLTSDGYPQIMPSLAEAEACLARILREDPLCYKEFRSTKGCYRNNLSFDDRAYIRFRY